MIPLEEKVARAMCIAAGHEPDGPTCDVYIPGDPDAIFPWAGYRGQARAAITVVVEAMREPSEAILAAHDHGLRLWVESIPRAEREARWRTGKIGGYKIPKRDKATARWLAMVAEFERSALSPTTPTGGTND